MPLRGTAQLARYVLEDQPKTSFNRVLYEINSFAIISVRLNVTPEEIKTIVETIVENKIKYFCVDVWTYGTPLRN
ncbi:MAG: hypothetical protein STSR0002_28870 [Smithella sp.]